MKPDSKTTDAVARLKNTHEYRVYQTHLQALLDEAKDLLVSSPPTAVPELQGRAKVLADLLKL